jgi:iron complex outermembrane receptor protein
MMVEKILSRSVRLMFTGSLILGAQLVSAQEATQRVEITGSSIKRIQAEGSLPVQTLSKAQIEQSGATNVADLIASLPALQGFISASASVNGGGGGLQTASIHGIGADYTLVLINGRRVAPTGSGSVVNLASIPLAAVERVEILTDGASALYGSDAISGVVNFILKKNQQDFQVDATYSAPETKPGKGRTTNFAISKGFGDLNKDNYNVLLSYSHDEQTELNASNRSFSKNGGLVPFVNNGKLVSLYQTSSNSIPANVSVKLSDGTGSGLFNPAYVLNGNCPAPNTFRLGNVCRYNFASTVELIPELKRDSFTASVNYQITPDIKFFAEGLYSKFTNTARYAPPAQPLSLDINSALYKTSIIPALVKLGVDPTQVVSASYNLRLVDAGGRTDEYRTDAKHLAFGIEGTLKAWDYNLAYVHSESKQIGTAVAGYTSGNAYDALLASGAYNPFIAPTAANSAALAPAVLHQRLDSTESKLDVVTARANNEIFKLPAGAVQLGVGVDFTKQGYTHDPSAIAQGPNPQQPNFTDTNVGGGTGDLPTDASRNSYGGFAELFIPVLKNLDVTLDGRYDKYDKIQDGKSFDNSGTLIGSGTKGNSQSASTYKLALAYRPTEGLLLRGSYGTGFRAPTLQNVVDPLKNFGSSGFHPCPITSGPLLPLCVAGSSEYNLLNGGNGASGDKGLKAEKSKQFTTGFRVEPIKEISLGFDFWDVKIKNQIQTLPENTIFDNPVTYAALFSSYYDPIQKQSVLAAALTPFNLANSHFQGIDWDHTFNFPTSIGKFAINWTGTYTLKSEQEIPGSDKVLSVGRFNEFNDVIFRLISKLAVNWAPTKAQSHTLTAYYHSSYHDESLTQDDGAVRAIKADGSLGGYVDSTRDVGSYTTFDWQSKYSFNKNLSLTAGIRNILDRDPPFTQRIVGGGNALGFDGRYTDPLGRQYYLVGNYKF